MAIAVLLALLLSPALGCAPVAPGNNETEVGTTGSFKMNVNPPAEWTTGSAPIPPQALDKADVEKKVHEDINQAVHLFLVDWKYPVDGINVTLDTVPTALESVSLVGNEPAECALDEKGFTQNTLGFVDGQCNSANSTQPFHVPISGKFSVGAIGVPITNELWKALAVSVQNKLMTTYHVGFGPGTEPLSVTHT